MRITFFLIVLLVLMPGTGLSGQLQINELMAYNTSGEVNPLLGERSDWIEICNRSGSPVAMTGLFISDDPGNPMKWKFPSDITVPAGGFLIVWADGTNHIENGCHTGFKLDVKGETVILCSASSGIIDSLTYPRLYENTSYGITGSGERAFFRTPTPGSPNYDASAYQRAGNVRFDPPAGVYPSSVLVKLVPGEAGGIIRYTADGSEPDPSDIEYTGPFLLSNTRVIRTRQWVDGMEPGEVTTASYIIREDHSIPVISLSTHPDNLWDDMTGIYVIGKNGIPGYCANYPCNWNQDWERPMSLEFFDLEGKRQLQIDGGVKIHGGCSRQARMKSLGFFARNKYGGNSMDHRFFREKDADSFKGLILRNAGNDYQYSFIRDAVIQAAVTPFMDLDGQAYEPVHVFLNSEYWGIHNLREKANEHWVATNYGIPAENLDFIKNHNEVFAGNMDAFYQLTWFLEENSLEEDANYQVVADQIDIGSYINYLITQMYFANRDWPGNNQKCWRDRVNDTKWRWMLYDMEFSMGLYGSDPAMDMFSFSTADDHNDWPNPRWATLLIRRLLENEGFRTRFLQEYMIHLNTTLSTERVIGVIDSIQNGIIDVFPKQIERWHTVSSMTIWNNRVDDLREFVMQRPGFVRENMRNFFALGDIVSLRVESPDQTGRVFVNRVEVPPEGFDGKYASGFDLNLEFKPAPGYRFDHWQVDSYESAGGSYISYDENPLTLRMDQGLTIRGISALSQMEHLPELVINEIMASNQGAFLDEYGNAGDWIEIYNEGDSDLDMAGLFLTDDLDDPGKWMVPYDDPEATSIMAGGYLVFFADENPLLGSRHMNFRLDADGEEVGLSYRSGPDSYWIDSVRFGTQHANVSLGRFPDADNAWIAMTQYTPGNTNIYTAIPVHRGEAWKVSLHPNPASDFLNVLVIPEGGIFPAGTSLRICDLTGRMILQHRIPVRSYNFNEKIDITALPDGVYLLVVETGSGTCTGKFIKYAR